MRREPAIAGLIAVGGAAVLLLTRALRARTDAAASGKSARSFITSLSISKRPKSWYDGLPTFKVKNSAGMEVEFSTLGAAITRMVVPDAKGRKHDIVLGNDDIQSYASAQPYHYYGVVVGRCANRIANAQFTIDGETHRLLANNGANCLHGGRLGLHKRVWEAREYSSESHHVVEMRYDSPQGEEGFPGHVFVTVTYRLHKHKNELTYTITATTDEATPVNIAQHSYFNLAGHNSGNVLNHLVALPSGDHYTPVDPDSLIPTGQVLPVAGTPFDFTQPHKIGERIEQVPGGYDHNFVLHNMGPQARFIVRKNGSASDKPKLAARVTDPSSGRTMEVLTTAPGVQFYTGNFINGEQAGKGGAMYPKHGGFCLETQGFPNAVNEKNFPTVVLQPEETYMHETVFRFTTTA